MVFGWDQLGMSDNKFWLLTPSSLRTKIKIQISIPTTIMWYIQTLTRFSWRLVQLTARRGRKRRRKPFFLAFEAAIYSHHHYLPAPRPGVVPMFFPRFRSNGTVSSPVGSVKIHHMIREVFESTVPLLSIDRSIYLSIYLYLLHTRILSLYLCPSFTGREDSGHLGVNPTAVRYAGTQGRK